MDMVFHKKTEMGRFQNHIIINSLDFLSGYGDMLRIGDAFHVHHHYRGFAEGTN
ncbi:hypothetical protein D3C77_661250 [compost metagenome]